jgi:hypothetical protein
VLVEREKGVLYIISLLKIDSESIRIDTRYRESLPSLGYNTPEKLCGNSSRRGTTWWVVEIIFQDLFVYRLWFLCCVEKIEVGGRGKRGWAVSVIYA